MQDPKMAKHSPSRHFRTTLSGYIFVTKARINNRKKTVKHQYLLHRSSQYGELGPLTAEISSRVCGTPANISRFRFLAVLLNGILVVVFSQTAHWTEGATYIRQGGHHVGHSPKFLVLSFFPRLISAVADWMSATCTHGVALVRI